MLFIKAHFYLFGLFLGFNADLFSQTVTYTQSWLTMPNTFMG